ncbi:NB-ARC domain-containing protein [Saccharopolyspora sp. NPDC047091]|uniref:NB-ARC domain-containing protein n=1 Tax=Saccharopolyspora sp. NPDC047091 TaxID=3155924 RepID=UPI0033EE7378
MSEKSEDLHRSGDGDEGVSNSNRISGRFGQAVQVGTLFGDITFTTSGVAAVGTGGVEALPLAGHALVPRPELLDEVIAALCGDSPERSQPSVGVLGGSGYGKTTLAAAVCVDERLHETFPDGVLWVTAGRDVGGPDLAGKINDLAQRLSGTRPSFTDPQLAGEHLAQLLSGKRCLVLVDDVWRKSQLDPFVPVGACRRLVTTRFPDVLPPGAAEVRVGRMKPDQARAALCAGWPHHHPDHAAPLLDRTQAWPALLSLANRAVCRLHPDHSIQEAAQLVADRIAGGARSVDRTHAEQRFDAAAAVIELNMSLLGDEHAPRCRELAIFPEDSLVPLETLRTYWTHTGRLCSEKVDALVSRMGELGLVQQCWLDRTPVIRVHEVVGDHLREAVGAAELAGYHRALLDAFDQRPVGAAVGRDLPPEDGYLRDRGAYHRRGAARAVGDGGAPRRRKRTRTLGRSGMAVVVAAGVLVPAIVAGMIWASQVGPARVPEGGAAAPTASGGVEPLPRPDPVPSPPGSVPAGACSSTRCPAEGAATAQVPGGEALVTLVRSATGKVQRYVQESPRSAPVPDPVDLGTSVREDPIIIPAWDGTLVGFVIDDSGTLSFNADVGGEAPARVWSDIGTGFVGTPAVVRDFEGRLAVFARDEEGHLHQIGDRTDWKPSEVPGSDDFVLRDDPEAVLDRNRALRIFGLGEDRRVHTCAQYKRVDPDAFGCQRVGGKTTDLDTTPRPALDGSGRLQLFARDLATSLRKISERDAPNTWPGEWTDVATEHTGRPVVVADGDGEIIAFARREDEPDRVDWFSGERSDVLATPMEMIVSATSVGDGVVVQGLDANGRLVAEQVKP